MKRLWQGQLKKKKRKKKNFEKLILHYNLQLPTKIEDKKYFFLEYKRQHFCYQHDKA